MIRKLLTFLALASTALAATSKPITIDSVTKALVYPTSGAINLGSVSITGSLAGGTGLPLTTGVTGTLPVANGGTGITSFGTGVATAFGSNTNTSGGLVTYSGAIGIASGLQLALSGTGGTGGSPALGLTGAWLTSGAGGMAQFMINQGGTAPTTLLTSGTGLAINASGTTADFVNFLAADTSKFKVDGTGVISALSATLSGATPLTIGPGSGGATAVIASNLSGATDPTITFGNALITSSSPIGITAAGAAGTPALYMGGDTTAGWYRNSAAQWTYNGASTNIMSLIGGGTVRIGNTLHFTNADSTATGDLFLNREGAAILQIGADAAGVVTPQTFKSCDRITSDGVGADMVIAGGRNRGASAGGSVILQTSPPASATTTGTLETGLTVASPTASMKPNVVVGNAALATTDTAGFLYIPGGAGAPAGTPTTYTGRYPLYWDTTNKQLYIYDGGWLQPKTPAAAAIVNWQ